MKWAAKSIIVFLKLSLKGYPLQNSIASLNPDQKILKYFHSQHCLRRHRLKLMGQLL